MIRLNNPKLPFLDNLITPTNKVKAYSLIDSELNFHKKAIENKHKVGLNLWKPV